MPDFRGYGQFCPVAKAAEVVAERWTPLILRELLMGSHHFNDLRRGVPLMSPSLLSRRLKELESVGVVERRRTGHGRGFEYRLTPSGRELRGVIEALGVWGRRWVSRNLRQYELDVALLMWDIRRRVPPERLPPDRVVIHFRIAGVPPSRKYWWLVLETDAVDLCMSDPGYPVHLTATAHVRTLTEVWVGDVPLDAALAEGRIELAGPVEYRRQFADWLGLSLFARVPQAARDPKREAHRNRGAAPV